jgi:hypothetical protein
MSATETVGARRAALLLYGLPALARERVLSKLTSDETARLRALLQELASLGIAHMPGYRLEELVAMPPPLRSEEKTSLEVLESLSANDVAVGLEECAPETAACLLSVREWPWQQAVLDRMGEPRRSEVLDRMAERTSALAPAVLAALCGRVVLESQQLSAAIQRTAPRAKAQISSGRIASFVVRCKSWIR